MTNIRPVLIVLAYARPKRRIRLGASSSLKIDTTFLVILLNGHTIFSENFAKPLVPTRSHSATDRKNIGLYPGEESYITSDVRRVLRIESKPT